MVLADCSFVPVVSFDCSNRGFLTLTFCEFLLLIKFSRIASKSFHKR